VVHHYIPGQPFYIRELVYRRVKNYMIEQGVRINDFGVLLRANHYFNKPIPVGKDISVLSTTTNKVEKEEFIAPNNSQAHIMAIWFSMEVIFGMLTYVIFDQWAFGNLLLFFYKLFMEIITGKNTTSKTTATAADKQKST
jgi:fatty acid desaturase